MESMISNVFINNDSDKIEELMVMIKLLSLSVNHSDSIGDSDSNDANIRVLICVLSSCKGKSISSPYTILEAITSIVTSSSSSSSSSSLSSSLSSYNLPNNEAESIRNLIVQCLHGGAPERVRDGTLSCIQDLMISSSSIISLSWTIEDNRAGASVGQFAMLLCSIVRGEFHLLLQELITLYDTNSDSNGDNNVKESISVERKERLLIMVFVCCSLMESFLCLLVGTSQSDDDVDSDDEVDVVGDDDIPIWSSLPYTCLLHMRESFHSVCQDIFEFIDIISKSSSSNSSNSITNNNDISKIIYRLIKMINIWVIEDESMITPCFKYIPSMLKCSVIVSLLSHSSDNINDVDDAKGITIWRSLMSNSNDVIIPFVNILKTMLDDDNDDNESMKQQLLGIPNLLTILVSVVTSICSNMLTSGYEEFQDKHDIVDKIFVLGYSSMNILVILLKWRSTEFHDDTTSTSIMMKKIRVLSRMMDMPSYDSIIPIKARKSLMVFKQTMKSIT